MISRAAAVDLCGLDGPTYSLEAFESRLSRHDRTEGCELLLDAWVNHHISRDTLTAVIGGVWSSAEYPDDPWSPDSLDHETWRMLFQAAGFTAGGRPAPRPTAPLRLYRGAVVERLRLWSWTTDLEMARFYAFQYGMRARGRVWTMVAPPAAMLCINTSANARDESEVVVDTSRRRITLLESHNSHDAEMSDPDRTMGS